MAIERIFRAYLDFMNEKYKHEHLPDKVHVHDLVRCKHKSELEVLFPEGSYKLSPVLFLGEAVDEFVKNLVTNYKEKLFPDLVSTTSEIEKKVNANGVEITIIGRPDIIINDSVIEVKYSRTPEDKPLEHHIAQLKLYMYLTDKRKGILVYFTPHGLREFIFEEEIGEDYVIELINNWKSPRYEWECQYCNYREICPYRIYPAEKKGTGDISEKEEKKEEVKEIEIKNNAK